MTRARTVGPALTALLERAVDYAGLFPPASLSMEAAVHAYDEDRRGAAAWMLGRFVVPASRLEAFDAAGREILPASAAESWALSALVSADAAVDMRSIHAFNDRHRDVRHGAVYVDTVEIRASHCAEILAAGEIVSGFDAFIEVPVLEDPDSLIAAVGEIGAKAKIRTGGVTADAIPAERHVVRFMRCCLEHGVAFKATAGLHHPLRAEYPLTYEAKAPRGTMYGFLNVLLAAALMCQGGDDAAVLALLDERDPSAIQLEGDRLRWREVVLTAEALHAARHHALAFGSCSFREPVDDLRRLGML
ncbi:MAG TPA: hypothetical protein VNF92_03745 [Gemmatimonadaceae bacterium]|nr:hypothetical protein [Gemmatimonadaceae bacterium]